MTDTSILPMAQGQNLEAFLLPLGHSHCTPNLLAIPISLTSEFTQKTAMSTTAAILVPASTTSCLDVHQPPLYLLCSVLPLPHTVSSAHSSQRDPMKMKGDRGLLHKTIQMLTVPCAARHDSHTGSTSPKPFPVLRPACLRLITQTSSWILSLVSPVPEPHPALPFVWKALQSHSQCQI